MKLPHQGNVRNGWKADIELVASCGESSSDMQRLRYLYYLAFAAAAVVFWLIVAVFVLGFFPVPYVPACQLEPGGCPEPTIWEELGTLLIVYGAIPATVLLFVFYRRWVRRKLGHDEDY